MSPDLLFAIILVVVLVAIGILLFIFMMRRQPERGMTGAGYKMFFYMGIGYLVVGSFLSFVYPGEFSDYIFLMVMGTIFASVGLANIEKWRK